MGYLRTEIAKLPGVERVNVGVADRVLKAPVAELRDRGDASFKIQDGRDSDEGGGQRRHEREKLHFVLQLQHL